MAAEGSTYKVALVGAGGISPHHALAVTRAPGAELAGVIDLDREKADELAKRFDVVVFESLADAKAAGVQSVHVLTPPHTHHAVARDAIELGLHVLVEKPLAVDADDVPRLGELATTHNVCLTTSHSVLFDPEFRETLELVRKGVIGDVVSVHIIRSSAYPEFVGPKPPQYGSPGYPFRDLGIHALYMLDALIGPLERCEFSYSAGNGDPLLAYNEWNGTVASDGGFGHVDMSWSSQPVRHLVLVQGTRGAIRADLINMYVTVQRVMPGPKIIERLANAWRDSVPILFRTVANVFNFAFKRRFAFQGIHDLVREHYRRLAAGEPAVIAIDDAERVVRLTELVAREADTAFAPWNEQHPAADECDVLVTGGTGKLGSRIVEALCARGLKVRVMCRRPPKAQESGVDYVVGDLGDASVVRLAVRGARAVVHAGAATSGGPDAYRRSTVEGTRLVLDAARDAGVERFVHISSLSVLDWLAAERAGVMDVGTPLESRPEKRGLYTQTKLESEQAVAAASGDFAEGMWILRPGQIYGEHMPVANAAVVRRVAGLNLMFGDGEQVLPLVHADDVAGAVVSALDATPDGSSVPPIHLVAEQRTTQNDVVKQEGIGRVVRLPRWLVMFLVRLADWLLSRLRGGDSGLTYRFRSAMARFEFARTPQKLTWTQSERYQAGNGEGRTS